METTNNTNNETNLTRILQRVRKMMALANDAAATEGERDNAIRMAHATLAKHNLTMAQAESSNDSQQQPSEKREKVGEEGAGYPWARYTAQSIGNLFFCAYFYVAGRHADKCTHYFVGRESNVYTAREMTSYVLRSILKEANKRRVGEQQTWTWHTSFCKGAAQAVRVRCAELRKQSETVDNAETKTPGTALVLANFYRTEMDANAAYIKDALQLHVKGKKTREHRPEGAGYYAGQTFGKSLSLNRQLGSK